MALPGSDATVQMFVYNAQRSSAKGREGAGTQPVMQLAADLLQGLSLQPQYLPVSVEFPSFMLVVFGLSCKLC